jgi:hypothetical protein
MFWLLMNHIVPQKERKSDIDMFQIYWVKWQLYEVSQDQLMDKMRRMQNKLLGKVHYDEIWMLMIDEFWELAFAKYMYVATRDKKIIKEFWAEMRKEMMEFLEKKE